jgi:hypothetical protein
MMDDGHKMLDQSAKRVWAGGKAVLGVALGAFQTGRGRFFNRDSINNFT